MSFFNAKIHFFFWHPQYKCCCNLCQQFFTWFFLFVEYYKNKRKSLDKRQCKNGIYLQNLQNCTRVTYKKPGKLRRLYCTPYSWKCVFSNNMGNSFLNQLETTWKKNCCCKICKDVTMDISKTYSVKHRCLLLLCRLPAVLANVQKQPDKNLPVIL